MNGTVRMLSLTKLTGNAIGKKVFIWHGWNPTSCCTADAHRHFLLEPVAHATSWQDEKN